MLEDSLNSNATDRIAASNLVYLSTMKCFIHQQSHLPSKGTNSWKRVSSLTVLESCGLNSLIGGNCLGNIRRDGLTSLGVGFESIEFHPTSGSLSQLHVCDWDMISLWRLPVPASLVPAAFSYAFHHDELLSIWSHQPIQMSSYVRLLEVLIALYHSLYLSPKPSVYLPTCKPIHPCLHPSTQHIYICFHISI